MPKENGISSSNVLTYKQSGVDIDAGNQLVGTIKDIVTKTHRPEVLTGIGSFGALFDLSQHHCQHPVLVSSTDGVGTKLKLAIELGIHQTIGLDLVAMCVNDLLCMGAEPLFFLDYYATGALDIELATSVITGIAEGCRQANIALIGGETAEMPGVYQGQDYDLAGFTVGIVDKTKILDGSKVQIGDSLIGIASSGPHANGYSLIRNIVKHNNTPLSEPFGDSTLGQTLLTPTKIYVQTIKNLLSTLPIHAIAHITGGGLIDNIPRVLPQDRAACLYQSALPTPPIFTWLQQAGSISQPEMWRTFNCGIGLVICVDRSEQQHCLERLAGLGESAWLIGEIVAHQGEPTITIEP